VLAAAVASALVFSAGAGVPFLGLLAVAAPFPLIVLRVRGSLGAAVLAALLAAVTIGTVFSTVQAVGFLAILAAPGLLMGETMARGRGLRIPAAHAVTAFERCAIVVQDPLVSSRARVGAACATAGATYLNSVCGFLEGVRDDAVPK